MKRQVTSQDKRMKGQVTCQDNWVNGRFLTRELRDRSKGRDREIGTGGQEDEGKVDKRLKGRVSSQDKRIG